MAKDFTSNLNVPSAYLSAMTQATQEKGTRKPRKTYTEEQAAEYIENLNTRGRKGLKMPRINVALRPDLLDYLKTISEGCGYNMTEYINLLLEADKKKNESLLKKVKSNREKLFAASIINGDT